MPKYQDIYPSEPLIQSLDLVRPLAADLPRNIWSKASPFKGIKSGLRMARFPRHIQSTKRKENIPYFKPPYCRGTNN